MAMEQNPLESVVGPNFDLSKTTLTSVSAMQKRIQFRTFLGCKKIQNLPVALRWSFRRTISIARVSVAMFPVAAFRGFSQRARKDVANVDVGCRDCKERLRFLAFMSRSRICARAGELNRTRKAKPKQKQAQVIAECVVRAKADRMNNMIHALYGMLTLPCFCRRQGSGTKAGTDSDGC